METRMQCRGLNSSAVNDEGVKIQNHTLKLMLFETCF